MKMRYLGAVIALVVVALLAWPAVCWASATPRAPATSVPQSIALASINSMPLSASPFFGEFGDMLGYETAYRINLNAGDQFAVRLSATHPDIFLGLLPPSATSIEDDFVAWGDAESSNRDYLQYVAPTSGTYYLLIYCGDLYPDLTHSRWYVEWAKTAGTAKSNIPGVELPELGATGTLSPLANWAEVYHVAVPAGEGLHLRLAPLDSNGDLDLALFNAGWTDIYRIPSPSEHPIAAESHTPMGFSEEIMFRAPTSSTYYPTVNLWHGPGPASYELTYKLTPMTSLAASTTATSLAYGQRLLVTGLLTEKSLPLAPQYVELQGFWSGSWHYVSDSETTTDTDYFGGAPVDWVGSAPFAPGTFVFTCYPTTNQRLRVSYPGAFWAHTPAASSVRDVSVRAYMPTPVAPSIVTHGRSFRISGTIRPKHAVGSSCPVVIKVERRLSSGAYTTVKTVKTRGYSGSGYTTYAVYTTLPSAGTWRVRAYHPADVMGVAGGNAATYSAYRAIKAR